MKASDTVMPFSQIEAIDLKNAESNFTDALYDVAREQAGISFKAGYKYALEGAVMNGAFDSIKRLGIKEVAGWIERYSTHHTRELLLSNEKDKIFLLVIRNQEWQSKLKEWGIDD